MPNRSTHVTAGILAGVAVTLYFAREQQSRHQVAEVLGGIVGGYTGARLPDILDPPFSPHHRSWAHGGIAVGTTVLSQLGDMRHRCRSQAADCESLDAVQALLLHFLAGLLTGFKAGYASHLVLDFRTPRSLPLLGR